jgi:hypothetical protein
MEKLVVTVRDRNSIKWAPFNSVVDGNNLVKSIEKEKNKIEKPTLSEEQFQKIENDILESMINKVPLVFTIFQGGFTKNIVAIATKIDPVKQKIFLSNNNFLYFREIINTEISYIN